MVTHRNVICMNHGEVQPACAANLATLVKLPACLHMKVPAGHAELASTIGSIHKELGYRVGDGCSKNKLTLPSKFLASLRYE